MTQSGVEEAVEAELVEEDAGALRQPVPWVTWLTALACVAVYLVLTSQPIEELGRTLVAWGVLRADPVWEGQFWIPLASVFIHVALWHLAFNLYWLIALGGALERQIGSKFFFLFLLASAVVTSGVQFAFSEATGIGATGVIYAIFGYMWVARKNVPRFQAVLGKQDAAIFILWLVGCLVATRMKLWGAWEIGNGAHISGLLLGLCLGAVFGRQYRVALFGSFAIALLVLSVMPLIWCPWSKRWVSRQAHESHMNHDCRSLLNGYRRCLELGQDPLWVNTCLAMLYYDMGDIARYTIQLDVVRTVSEQSAEDVERYVRARKAEKSGGAPAKIEPRPEQRELPPAKTDEKSEQPDVKPAEQ